MSPCLLIIEKAVVGVRHCASELKLDDQQLGQLTSAMENAFSSIVAILTVSLNKPVCSNMSVTISHIYMAYF